MAKIHKGDQVVVVAGRDRGKKAEVQRVLLDDQTVMVTGVNLVKRNQKGQPGVRQAGIIQKEMPMHWGKVMLLCKHCGKPTRVGYKFLEDGRKVRVCHHCKEVLD